MNLNQKMEDELYQELTKFQKDLVDSIKNVGFTWKYGGHYLNSESVDIDVKRFSRWSEVLLHFYKEGKWVKTNQIKNVLGIIDPVI